MFRCHVKRSLRQTARSFGTVSGHYDAVIIGGGIAGAAAALGITSPKLGENLKGKRALRIVNDDASKNKRVLVIEAERDFCYHSTGRSAAIYSEVYGTPSVRALSTATKPFYYDPVVFGVSEEDNLVNRRGTVWVGTKNSEDVLQEVYESTKELVPSQQMQTEKEVYEKCKWIRNPDPVEEDEVDEEQVAMFGGQDNHYTVNSGMQEPDAADMDVNEIYKNMVRLSKLNGATWVSDTQVKRATRKTTSSPFLLEIVVEPKSGSIVPEVVSADVVVNAAGAWADEVAVLLGTEPKGLTPKQRTIIQFQPEEVVESLRSDPEYLAAQAHYPSVMDISDRYYYKPDAGRVLASPCDEVPVHPHDTRPTPQAQAVCIDRIERASALRPKTIVTSWAGMRTFTPDHEFLLGVDDNNVWWIAGLGGYGIQTAFGNARFISGLYHRGVVPEDLVEMGINKDALSPTRNTAH